MVVVAKKSYVGKIFRPVYYVRSPAGRCRNKLEVLARPRPIKLRVNLAPQMIEGGASPVEKNFRGRFLPFFMFAHLKEKMELLHQADYYFSHPIARRQERKAAKVAEKISCRPSYPTRCIFSYSDYKKTHKQPFSVQLSFVLFLNGRQEVGQCASLELFRGGCWLE